MDIKGAQFGVRIAQRGRDDRHATVQLLSEDDENWFSVGQPFSSFWIDDLISQLQAARSVLAAGEKDPSGFGYLYPSDRGNADDA